MASPGLSRAPEPACRTAWAPSRRPNRCRASGVACGAQVDARRQAHSVAAAASNAPERQFPANSSSSSSSNSSTDGGSDGSSGSSGWAWQQELPRRTVGLLAAAAVAAAGALGPAAAPQPAGAVTQEQLLFLEAWRAVDRAYVDKKFNGQNWFKVREDALKKAPLGSRQETHDAIRALLASLGDPFTRFLQPDQYSALRRSTAGAVTGVGVEVSFRSAQGGASTSAGGEGAPLVVIAPAPGGPAERAGIRPGDEIVAIDGQPAGSLSLYAVGNLLQGPEGTQVTLAVRPGSGGATKDVQITRQPIQFQVVDSALCSSSGRLAPGAAADSKLGYIRIASFSKQTAEKVRAALAELKQQGVDRLVLDVRNNGGGLFPAGVEVGRMLLDRGDIVLIADSDGVRDIYSAEGSALDATTPLVVLVNRGTASASEVLAGALKDNRRAAVAGENTFGKGAIQTLVELSDGSAVAVTVAKYQTPAGIDINRVGIAPTIPLTADQLADIPLDAGGFCRFAQTDAAPALF